MEPYNLSEEYYSGGKYDRPLEGVDSCFNQDGPKADLAPQEPKRNSGADVKLLERELQELKKEMKAQGVRRISCFNAGLNSQERYFNSGIFSLKTQIDLAKKKCAP